MASIEVKVKKLDAELARYKDQMSKLRNGPGKVHLGSPNDFLFGLNVTHTECDTTTSTQDAETEEDVRITDGAAHAANVQHGVCRARN